MGYFKKDQTGGVQDMDVPGVSKNSKWIFWGLIKNNAEFPEVTKKKLCGVSRGLGFVPYSFQVVSGNFGEFLGVKPCFVLNFQG